MANYGNAYTVVRATS